jgi:RNA polymerase sigma-70 factor (ECF subfamily)
MPLHPVDEQLAQVVRVEGGRVVAVLARTLGDLGRAEDAVQDATLAALQTWPRTGVPEEPRAWLLTVARRKALDVLRREQRRTGKEAQSVALLDQLAADGDDGDGGRPDLSSLDDDLLRLVFTCCHPALRPEAQVALTLRTVCGLSVAEVARVLLLGEETAAKRLVRTRKKIARAGIPYRVPSDEELPDRLAPVAAVVHLIFTAGYAGSPQAELVRVDLCAEAIRLARLLDRLLPGEPRLQGLLALLLLTHARRDARTDEAGDLVLLADQDRNRWHRREIDEAAALLVESLRRTDGLADRYQLEAAIAACHVSASGTDWTEVVRLYDLLMEVAPSPAVAVNRAVALAELHGPAVALPVVEGLVEQLPAGASALGVHAAHADLLRRLGRTDAAVVAYGRALASAPSRPERRFLERRLDVLSATTPVAPAHGSPGRTGPHS